MKKKSIITKNITLVFNRKFRHFPVLPVLRDFCAYSPKGCQQHINAHWISKNNVAAVEVQCELCGTNFRENIANLRVSCYNGGHDRFARPASSGAGRMITSKPEVARASFAPLPRPGHYPLIITLVRHKKSRSTAKCMVQHKKARFDTKMPSPVCISWHYHYHYFFQF